MLRNLLALRFLGSLFLLSYASPHLCADDLSFNQDIRPILSDHCFACHGFDEKQREADLRLDIADGGYQAITPGDPESSEFWLRISAKDDTIMPPEDFHKPLDEEDKKILKRWIQEGAPYQQHWSFIAPVKPDVPELDADHPIDSFLLRAMQNKGLKPNPLADKETLIRRLTLDLTGLPPTPEEVTAFVTNDSPTAYEDLVDDLQSRTSYGEHMARYWLDLARYADTHGLHLDNKRSMWPYRDWVVRAFNQNLPFDEFTRWQLAGDLLPNSSQEQLIASGFNRCNVSTSEGGSINEEWIYRYAVDRTTTAVEVWMGLTAGCAVCHDHKYDPLSTKEYYSMYAFFHSAADPAMDGNIEETPPVLKIVSDEDQQRAEKLREQLSGLERELEERLLQLPYEDPALLAQKPLPETIEEVWFDDSIPTGGRAEASGGPALTLVSAEQGPVFRGKLAIQRKSENQISQDIFYTNSAGLRVPDDGTFFIHCYLEPNDAPESIMVQFHTGNWKNRAVWGQQDKIGFGKPDTTEKVYLGELPEVGKWIRLEMDAKRLGLKPGTKISGFAFTQFGGTVAWDNFGVRYVTDKANDRKWSWHLWSGREFSKGRKELPNLLRRALQGRNIEDWTPEEVTKVKLFWLKNVYAGARDLVQEFDGRNAPIQKEIDQIEESAPATMIMADLPNPRESFVMLRGAYDNRGDPVSRGVPSFLPPLPPKPEGESYNRLDLANWLLQRDHPLTSRVAVNRFWQQFFGTGIVKTSADFGSQGEPPSHPELLDWLAIQFMEDGWDMKKFVKRIVTSHAYRQSSEVTAPMLQVDPENRLLARAPRLRLDAEVLRDQALFLGGLLVPTVGGPGVRPYQPPNIWEPVGFGNSNTRYYEQDTGENLYRRSLYTFLKRTAPPPFMSTFDAPNREQSCSRRQRSNTPLQALQLMNDIQHVEAARAFAERIMTDGGDRPESRIRWAWKNATAREPESEELQLAIETWNQLQERYAAAPEDAQSLIQFGESEASSALPSDELAAYTLLANLLLNMDEVINKN